MASKKHSSSNFDVIAVQIEYIQDAVIDIKKKLDNEYVTQDEFDPIKRIVYGLVSTVFFTVVGGVIALVIRTGNL